MCFMFYILLIIYSREENVFIHIITTFVFFLYLWLFCNVVNNYIEHSNKCFLLICVVVTYQC